jgi:TniQ
MMVDMAHCFFDVLPVHPQPEPVESFTGYLTRLGEANGMERIGNLVITAFPNTMYQPSDAIKVLSDYSTLSFGALSIAAACSEIALQATTLFHLGKKFGRLSLPETLGRFFQYSFASNRRYCPLCLSEHSRPYYSLIWQFLCIPGCVSHNCHFLEECGYCGYKLPLLPSPPSVTICPICRGDLRTLMPPPLSTEDSKKAVTSTSDIAFLIAPHDGEQSQERVKFIGLQIAHLRRIRGLSSSEAAIHIQTNERRIGAIESGDVQRGVIFSNYIAYADYLGTSLSALYEASLSEQNYSQILEAEWVVRVKTAIQQLESLDKPVSYRAIAKIVGASHEHLGILPYVKAILDTYQIEHQHGKSQRFQQKQEVILEQAQAAIGYLEALGKPITMPSIGDIIGISRPSLRKYLRGTTLLKKIVEEGYYDDGTLKLHRREKELIELVQSTIQKLQSLDEPITKKTVADKIGMSQSGLYQYASIRELVKEYTKPSQRGHREVELVELVQNAIETLRLQGNAIGYQSVSQMTGISKKVLRRYLQVRMMLDETIECVSHEQCEAEKIVTLVQEAIEFLELQEEIIGYQSVSKIVGVSQSVLQHNIRVRLLLENAIEKQQSELWVIKIVKDSFNVIKLSGENIGYKMVGKTTKLSQQVLQRYLSVRNLIEENMNDQQRENKIVENVCEAIKELRDIGEPTTLANICRHVHLTQLMLKSYPRVRELLEQLKQIRHDKSDNEFQQKEDEFVGLLQIAIPMLKSLDKPVTGQSVSEMVGVSYGSLQRYPRAKALLEIAIEDQLHQRSLKKQQREEELVNHVQKAIKELVSLEIPVTQTAISQKVGLSLRALKQYPRVREIMKPSVERSNQKSSISEE